MLLTRGFADPECVVYFKKSWCKSDAFYSDVEAHLHGANLIMSFFYDFKAIIAK
ncbi:hypothetical protein DFR42_1011084 [Undibacterium pigrum]|uniref:Uncharacterized protein n=1 Tax=Undibacterium pigrum TaxID=401470 RepID=A0A318JJG8_9BURK|nr:hypothetical protein DFR42_1011084 [Undibacterium pigrum]